MIRLSANEAPEFAKSNLIGSVWELREMNRYPDKSQADILTHHLARHCQVHPKNIHIGNGSSEVLTDLATMLSLDPGSTMLTWEHSFVLYKMIAHRCGRNLVEVPRTNFHVDPESARSALTPETKVIFLDNPSNPAGTKISRSSVTWLLENIPKSTTLILDQAYLEYSSDPEDHSICQLPLVHKNIVVTRTFSKAYGLAGYRLGYAIMHESLAARLGRFSLPFRVNPVSVQAGVVALQDPLALGRTIAQNRRSICAIEDCCRALNLPFVPSRANFLLIEVGVKRKSALLKFMDQRCIEVCSLGHYDLPGHIRVSSGTVQETRAFTDALRAFCISSQTVARQSQPA